MIDLKNVKKLDDKDQALFLLFFVPNLFDNFVNFMLYSRYTIFLKYVKSSLNFGELHNKNG